MVHGRAIFETMLRRCLPFEHLLISSTPCSRAPHPAPPSRAAACGTHRCEAKGCLAHARSEASGCLASLARWDSRLDNMKDEETGLSAREKARKRVLERRKLREAQAKNEAKSDGEDNDKKSLEQLAQDLAALRKLRDDDGSGVLKEFFGDGEDPRKWNNGYAVKVADGRVTKLSLYKCTKLTALPDAIGELGALTMLDLRGCSSLEKLPDAVATREGLTIDFPAQFMRGPLGEDFTALRKLRDDDASGMARGTCKTWL